MENVYKNNGDYTLEKCTLTIGKDDKKTELDLSNIYLDITIYESLHTPFISGVITISDNNNLLDFATLGNGERLNIEFATAGNSTTIKGEYLVYATTTPIRNNEHSMIYGLQFASHPFIYAKRLRHWNATKEKSFSEVVTDIFKKLQDSYEGQKKELKATEVENSRHIVFTGHDTMEAIDTCSRYAKSKDGYYAYLFYENNQEFCFKPIEELFKQEPLMEYNIAQSGAYSGYGSETTHDALKSAHEEAFNNYQDFEFEHTQNFLDKVMNGLLGATYNFVSLRDRYNLKIPSNAGEFRDNALTDNQFMADHITVNSDGAIYVLPQTQLYGDEENVVRRDVILKRNNNVAINIATFGNSALKVGDMIKANIPRWHTEMGEDIEVDKYSGLYLISEIKHVLNRNAYNTRLKIVRDGFNDKNITVEDKTPEYKENPDTVKTEYVESTKKEESVLEKEKQTEKAMYGESESMLDKIKRMFE